MGAREEMKIAFFVAGVDKVQGRTFSTVCQRFPESAPATAPALNLLKCAPIIGRQLIFTQKYHSKTLWYLPGKSIRISKTRCTPFGAKQLILEVK